MTKALCISAVLICWEMVSYQLFFFFFFGQLEAGPSSFIYVLNLPAGADIFQLSVGKHIHDWWLAS